MDWLRNGTVAIARQPDAEYNAPPPFHPAVAYPEYPFAGRHRLAEHNDGYELVRRTLRLAGLDRENHGTGAWNPLGALIRPGDRVVLKPNLVYHRNKSGGSLYAVITHPSIIRAVCDYAYIALRGKGELVIADAPQADCDLARQLEQTELLSICRFYDEHASLPVPFYDLRKLRHVVNEKGFLDSRSREGLSGDPRGYRIVDLGADSDLAELGTFERVYGADYYRAATAEHHGPTKNEYCISATVLAADVVISIPKMKLHYKVGVTLNLKNLVGINGDKNYLPHFRVGSPAQGGDEYPSEIRRREKLVLGLQQRCTDWFLARNTRMGDSLYAGALAAYRRLGGVLRLRVPKDIPRSGDWWGNDTAWRMTLDLNRILMYADGEGRMQSLPQRRYFSVIDGILGGEGNGPLGPDPRPSGAVVCGFNPVAVDHVTAALMGLDPEKIRLVHRARGRHRWPLWLGSPPEMRVESDMPAYRALLSDPSIHLGYRPPASWKGHIEWTPGRAEAGPAGTRP